MIKVYFYFPETRAATPTPRMTKQLLLALLYCTTVTVVFVLSRQYEIFYEIFYLLLILVLNYYIHNRELLPPPVSLRVCFGPRKIFGVSPTCDVLTTRPSVALYLSLSRSCSRASTNKSRLQSLACTTSVNTFSLRSIPLPYLGYSLKAIKECSKCWLTTDSINI